MYFKWLHLTPCSSIAYCNVPYKNVMTC
uniref:Uncharacterized protein n=1 Tax=Anguilla anguilla TaxID=7936 RepID=A0A0E9T823_ANGAN